MSTEAKVSFAALDDAFRAVTVVFAGKNGALSETAVARLGQTLAARIAAAASAESFSGSVDASLALPAQEGMGEAPVHLLIIGCEPKEGTLDFLSLGGKVMGKAPKGRDVAVLGLLPSAAFSPQQAAQFALGAQLGAYRFDRYQSKKKGDEAEKPAGKLTMLVESPSAARKAWKLAEATYAGVVLARDLVNEPANILTPSAFAARAAELEALGVEIEVLGEKDMKKLGMRALLGVGQGSHEESKLVIMKWCGAQDEKAAPLAFIGKGVVFDTGGISIKPAAGMEDMKGDMGGAAAVTGLMKTLAMRKAKVNVIGAIGLVENMPDGKAQRPGDIVTSMSGQTIEIINTDAEGRLVLCDVLWHIKHKFDPQFMVNLATLTGAIMVALGQEHAGLFSNNDELAENLAKAGKASGEKLWRLPLGPEYDKQIDSKFADMKNTGGRYGGSITAAQFLQRFVDGCPWAHLDIAGTAMGSPQNDINKSWGSGFGVRLLDRLVADYYEK